MYFVGEHIYLGVTICAKEHIWRSEEWELILSFYKMGCIQVAKFCGRHLYFLAILPGP